MIDKIVSSLLESTKNGSIHWTEKESIFTTKSKKFFVYKSEDNLTEFKIEICLKDGNLESSCLMIKNDELDTKFVYVYERDFYDLRLLSKILYDNLISPNIKITDKKDIFYNILNSIGNKSSRREERLKEILNEGASSSVPEEKKSIWEKIKKLGS